MTIKHLLFIPRGRLEGLLERDPCGGRAPMATRFSCFELVHHEWGIKAPKTPCGCEPSIEHDIPGAPAMKGTNAIGFIDPDDRNNFALALIWDGTPQPMGIWPLVTSMPLEYVIDGVQHQRTSNDWLLFTSYTVGNAVEIARNCERLGMGTVVEVER